MDYVIPETIIRLCIAVVLGMLVGLERQRLEWAAGLRTHMLVCTGSCLFMIVSIHGFSDVVGKPGVELDPSRVAAQVVSGIGFIGAGTILFLRGQVVRGLTTAAGLWSVAAVGLAVGGGLYVAATFTTVLILIILAVIKPIEKRIFNSSRIHALKVIAQEGKVVLQDIEKLAVANQVVFTEIRLYADSEDKKQEFDFEMDKLTPRNNMIAFIEQLRGLNGIVSVNLTT
ncbi:MgtC/SapB family protein [Pedobacter sp. BS3]|uniref:MgtC/SapB family protein n=1 Tax=Pedobacter sp. BS3 TaxID=2567937 RepID=UPI0011EF2FB1|nr:MgtC/SapB family protein [Pedobacter sp. BS3]TZF81501.1 MgtC/SapB family protein [Pedobacter sp. BS3]